MDGFQVVRHQEMEVWATSALAWEVLARKRRASFFMMELVRRWRGGSRHTSLWRDLFKALVDASACVTFALFAT